MKKTSLVKWILSGILVTAAVFTLTHYYSQLTVENIECWVNQFSLTAPLVFISIFVVSVTLFLPGSIFALAGGALFGPVYGTIYNLTAATFGAILSFFIARYLASDWVAEKSGGKLKEIMEGVASSGWRFVAFVRLVPLFPYNLLNYTLGLTKIRSPHFILATFVCMSPGAAAYTYIGYLGREVASGGENLVHKGIFAFGLLSALILLPGLVKQFFPRLRDRMTPAKDKREINKKPLISKENSK